MNLECRSSISNCNGQSNGLSDFRKTGFIQFVFLGTMPSSVVLCNEWNRFALFRYVANMVLCFL